MKQLTIAIAILLLAVGVGIVGGRVVVQAQHTHDNALDTVKPESGAYTSTMTWTMQGGHIRPHGPEGTIRVVKIGDPNCNPYAGVPCYSHLVALFPHGESPKASGSALATSEVPEPVTVARDAPNHYFVIAGACNNGLCLLRVYALIPDTYRLLLLVNRVFSPVKEALNGIPLTYAGQKYLLDVYAPDSRIKGFYQAEMTRVP